MENEILNKILDKLEQLDQKLDHLEQKVDARFIGIDARFIGIDARFDGIYARFDGIDARFDGIEATLLTLQESVNRIELSQQEDIVSVIRLIDLKLEDTAKKSDIDGLKGDLEFIVKENSIFNLELDRLKRNAYE
jgi:regulator of replication initiation timing